MKKSLCLLLCLCLLFGIAAIPVSAETNVEQTQISIDFSGIELPDDDEPVPFVYDLGPIGKARASSYIVFWITRDSVVWNVVNLPSSYTFNGRMTIVNLTSGWSSGSAGMYGRNGYVSYATAAGNYFGMTFYGDVMNGSKFVSEESGGHSWRVPVK